MQTEIRTRFLTPSAQTLYEAVVTADGKRRVLRDNLGVIEVVEGGWKVTIGTNSFINEDRDQALLQATRDIRLMDMLKEMNG
jgi:hypothetical protein